MSKPYASPYRDVGVVEKTIGAHGDVIIRLDRGLMCGLPIDVTAYLVPPLLTGINEVMIEAVSDESASPRVGLAGVGTIDDASTLVGRHVLVARDDLADDTDRFGLVGRMVSCVERGPLGEVVSLMETPANDVLEVEGRYGTVLIPVIEECLLDVPEDVDEPILVKLLPGLIADEAR